LDSAFAQEKQEKKECNEKKQKKEKNQVETLGDVAEDFGDFFEMLMSTSSPDFPEGEGVQKTPREPVGVSPGRPNGGPSPSVSGGAKLPRASPRKQKMADFKGSPLPPPGPRGWQPRPSPQHY